MKKINRTLVLITAILSTYYQLGYTQLQPEEMVHGYFEKIIPPSPTAASLAKFADIPVSYYTGRPNISVPLAQVKGHSLTLPVSLSYDASGYRVAETPGWTGLGWALNAGGVITRTVYGKPDELGEGYNKESYLIPDPSKDYNMFLNWEPDPSLKKATADGKADFQPDIYSYNFDGHSGKFVMYKGKVYTIPYDPIDVEGNSTGWTITTPDGIKYVFGVSEDGSRSAESRSILSGDMGTYTYISAWYLMQIIAPGNSDEIDLYYQPQLAVVYHERARQFTTLYRQL